MVMLFPEDMWLGHEPGVFEGVVRVFAVSQGDEVQCDNPADVLIEILETSVESMAQL